jgi:ATP-dependent Clp protease ATP-binding subunit ClpC
MLERLTERARRVVELAKEEARSFNHDSVGTDHLLLALIGEGEGIAAKALLSLGLSWDDIADQIREIIGEGDHPPTGNLDFGPLAKSVFELSLREALQLGHNYIGTEHLLLALLRDPEGLAVEILAILGVKPPQIRRTVIGMISGRSWQPVEDTPPQSFPGFTITIGGSGGGSKTVSYLELPDTAIKDNLYYRLEDPISGKPRHFPFTWHGSCITGINWEAGSGG